MKRLFGLLLLAPLVASAEALMDHVTKSATVTPSWSLASPSASRTLPRRS